MRALFILVVSCFSALASDKGVHMTSNWSTNSETGIHLEEAFTRNGQTNLIRKSTIRDGSVAGFVQRLYHEGEFVAVHVVVTRPANMARESFTTTESSYSVQVNFSPNKDVEGVFIRKHGKVIDAFTVTNRLFYPVSTSDLEIRPSK